jgi:four helix bundle protein
VVRSFKELVVWKRAYELTIEVYSSTSRFPRSETFGLVTQMRGAAVSIVSNIAEGYGRGHRGEYIKFLRMAYGSSGELETQLMLSEDLGYLNDEKFKRGSSLLLEVQKMLGSMLRKFGSESHQQLERG